MTTGSKYQATKNLTPVQVARLVRADLKTVGRRPGVTFAVRGNSREIVVTIKGYTGQILDRSGVHHLFAREARDLGLHVRDVVDAYNRDDSDPLTDHFASRFRVRVQYAQHLGMNCS